LKNNQNKKKGSRLRLSLHSIDKHEHTFIKSEFDASSSGGPVRVKNKNSLFYWRIRCDAVVLKSKKHLNIL